MSEIKIQCVYNYVNVAAHLFLKVFLEKLKENIPTSRKIIYFSDGSAGKLKVLEIFVKHFLNHPIMLIK